MSCEHSTTTTLLWLYGDLPDDESDHALHIAGCAACTEVVTAHSDVVVAVTPVGPALREPVAPVVPAPANNARWLGVALSAAVLLAVVWVWLPTNSPTPAPEVAAVTGPVLGARASIDEFDPDFSDLDERLDALEADLDLL